jgi:hypothetical protein
MSASNLFNIDGDLSLQTSVKAQATTAVLLASYRSLVIVGSGRATLATGAGVVTIAYPGLLVGDIVFATAGGVPIATPANAGIAVAGWVAVNDVLSLQSAFATSGESVQFLIYRPNV